MCTDDNLVLSSLIHHTFDTFYPGYLIFIRNTVVLQHKTQSRHTVGHVDNVFFSTYSCNYFFCQLGIICFCHFLPSPYI